MERKEAHLPAVFLRFFVSFERGVRQVTVTRDYGATASQKAARVLSNPSGFASNSSNTCRNSEKSAVTSILGQSLFRV